MYSAGQLADQEAVRNKAWPQAPRRSLWGAEGRPQAEVETPKVVNDRSEGGVSEHRDGASGPPREVKDPF